METRKMKSLPYLLILPAFALILVFKLYPIAKTLLEGFTYQGQASLQTYKNLFIDPTFWNSLWVTFKINIVMTPVQIVLAFFMAMLANSSVRGIGIFRTIFYFPVTISLTVGTILWNMMFNVNNGVLNSLLGVFGIAPQGFLIDKRQAWLCIVVIATWKGVGYWMMFILAGLKNIDASIYESAKLDGAGFFKTIIRITLPMIKRVMLFVFVADTTTNLLLFAPMQLITRGGPESSTNVLMYEAYKSAFQFVDRSRSAAIISVLLLIIVIVCFLQFRLLNEKEEA